MRQILKKRTRKAIETASHYAGFHHTGRIPLYRIAVDRSARNGHESRAHTAERIFPMEIEENSTRRAEILAMFDEIPIATLKAKALELLDATKSATLGRDREPVVEPDNAIRLRVWETIIAHSVGAPGSRKAPEPPAPTANGKGGKLVRDRKAPDSKAEIPPA